MIWTLIRKDARLLRYYLRSAVVVTICCYLVPAIALNFLEISPDPDTPRGTAISLLVLVAGRNFGFISTGIFSALMAGSVFTLERSDRSAEFLACLPPTRRQNLVSKLSVILGPIGSMISVHILASIAAIQVAAYAPADSFLQNRLAFATDVFTYVAIIASTFGGALAASALLSSNGVPILCGLFCPFLVLSMVMLFGYVLDIPAEGDAFAMRYGTNSFAMGSALSVIGCYWYLTGNSP